MTEIADIQKPFAKWLREHGLPFVQARSDKRSTVASGWPDFTICYQGRVLLIECKVEKSRPSRAQGLMHRKLFDAGNTVTIARSLEACISAVRTWLGASEVPAEAPARKERRPLGHLRIVNWSGVDAIVLQRGRETDFVRLARPDDILTIPRA